MKFLPDDYEAPRPNGHYLKFEEGENRVRILSEPIIGWEDWHEKKPVRYPYDQKPEESYDPKRPVKHFWSMVVWNYRTSSIQILHITQASIRKAIEALYKDSDWGAPYGYDLKIYKSGEGVETEYSVNPVSTKPVAQDIIQAFMRKPCWLNALFDNEDPFDFAKHGKNVPGMFDLPSAIEKAPETKSRAVAPKPNLKDAELEIELFIDFLPHDLDTTKVTEFVDKCAAKTGISPEEYCASSIDNIPHFVTCYTKWLNLPHKAKATA